MNKSAVLALLIVGGYIAFELNALRENRYRMEPGYVYGEFVGARHALALCAEPESARQERFERNFAAVSRNNRASLAEQYPEESAADIEHRLTSQRAAREATVAALVDDQGCQGPEVWRLLKLYEVRARLNLRG